LFKGFFRLFWALGACLAGCRQKPTSELSLPEDGFASVILKTAFAR